MSERQRSRAKQLRRELTPAERKLWHALKAHRFSGLQFRRQVPIGPYIADFVCHSRRLVIEVDGEQHGFDREAARDRHRDAWFESQAYKVLRFWNGQVLYERETVLDTIYAHLLESAATELEVTTRPSPPSWGRVGEGGPQSQTIGEPVGGASARTSPCSETLALDAQRLPSLSSPTREEPVPESSSGSIDKVLGA